MKKIRDEISKVTGFYFSEKTPMSQSFIKLQKSGRFDAKTMISVFGVICDYMEELEKKK